MLTLTISNDYIDILLVDEPCKSLSQNYLQQVMNIVNNYNDKTQIILVTHNPKLTSKNFIQNEENTFIHANKKNDKIEFVNIKNELKKKIYLLIYW